MQLLARTIATTSFSRQVSEDCISSMGAFFACPWAKMDLFSQTCMPRLDVCIGRPGIVVFMEFVSVAAPSL